MLLFQRNAGGWPKGKNYQRDYSSAEWAAISNDKRKRDCTFDNDATYTELYYLAKVYTATNHSRHKDAFNRGLDYIFEAQYENGGWPQYYPESHKIWSRANSRWNPDGLEHFITYNDHAMIGIMRLLKGAADAQEPFVFVDEYRRQQAGEAVERGIKCILKSQFYYDGRKTAWPAQVDEASFAPKWGRNFEPLSIASDESVEIIRFLMSIEQPDQEIIYAVQSAVKWLDEVKILNTAVLPTDTMTVIEKETGIVHTGRRDTYLKHDPEAPPVWARFYELNTFRPVFSNRDDTVRYSLSEISLERRSGYAWYGAWPEKILSVEYPQWCKKHNIENVLE